MRVDEARRRRRMPSLGLMRAFTALVACVGVMVVATPAHAGPAPNPFDPAFGHPYRHGAVPTRDTQARIDGHRSQHPDAVPADSSANLRFGGGVDGIGVTVGTPQVYLVFWGSGWGSASSDGNGDTTFSNDPFGGAARLQQMFKGLGTGGEQWSGTMTQYCEGVPTGTQICGTAGAHVGYPSGGDLAGVWYDNSSVPLTTTGHQIAIEAVAAAGHFGNTSPAQNRRAQYVILSATGYHPDGWSAASGFCAWHDWNGDSDFSGGPAPSPYGDIAFTNLPYVMDAGANCGANFVNSGPGGAVDGYTIVEGHEYAETLTDQNPRGGYTDSSGAEDGDKCAWIPPGNPGGAGNVATGNGSYPEQSTWSNDNNGGSGGCTLSHPIVTGPAGRGADLARNGGFNIGTAYWSAEPGTDWQIHQDASTGNDPYEGNGFASVSASQSGGGIFQDIPMMIAPGDTYCASARVVTLGTGDGAEGILALWFTGVNANENQIKGYAHLPGGDGWTLIQTCATATSSHNNIRVQFYPIVGGGTTGIDTVDVHRDLARNGGFNAGTAYWSAEPGTDWQIHQDASTGNDPYEGNGFVSVSASQNGGGIFQDIPTTVQPGDTYCASARVVTLGTGDGAEGILALWFTSPTAHENQIKGWAHIAGGDGWTLIQTCATASASYNNIRVQFYPIVGGGTTGIDTVDVHQDLVRNGGFNVGTAYWSAEPGTDWQIHQDASTGNDPYEGNGFVSVSASQSGGGVFQDIPTTVQPGDTYCASARVVTLGTGDGAEGILALWFTGVNPSENQIKGYAHIPGGDGWTLIQTCATATSSHNNIRVQFYPIVGGGTTGIDTVDIS